MLTTKQFLQAELCNVERALNESLRYDYGGRQSLKFYTECMYRHQALKELLSQTQDQLDLQEIGKSLSELSGIIARIERSRFGEYSRAFADALSETARAACMAHGDSNDPTSPLFFFCSEGGLGSYAIYPDQEEMTLRGRLIFNVIFPRSLKHHVLLHPILGHEAGHALMGIPLRAAQLRAMLASLFVGSPFENVTNFRRWFDKYFPEAQADKLEDEDLENILQSWHEEFFCDLFGLISMGPSFLAAIRTLFAALDIEGNVCGESHPPTLARYAMLEAAVHELKWDQLPKNASPDLAAKHKYFWDEVLKTGSKYPWLPALDPNKVGSTIRQLGSIFSSSKGVLFEYPEANILGDLVEQLKNNIPPAGYQDFKSASINLVKTDYRAIIYAGWLALVDHSKAAYTMDNDRFLEINRLCDHAILQQEAIATQIVGSNTK